VSDTTPVLLTGLAPVSRADARVLILGSMPGAASLAAARYYAHPANAFWPLLAGAFGEALPDGYRARCAWLNRHRVALWDVVQRCVRPGSLDTAIRPDSVVANDIAAFLRAHRAVTHLFFNGSAAERLFQRHLGADPEIARRALCYVRLPSSSPAHAALSRERKQEAWRSVAVQLR